MIAEMMAQRVADEVAQLKAVRPVVNGRPDKYPHSTYETVDMRSKRFLNCASAQRDGTVRFFISGHSYADVSTNTEAIKDALIGWTSTGADYRIRIINLADETDIFQDDSDPKHIVYVKSVDFAVKALKL